MNNREKCGRAWWTLFFTGNPTALGLKILILSPRQSGSSKTAPPRYEPVVEKIRVKLRLKD
ncbi:hypothetical protein A11S_2075 [Micavibrio aeruginosavorus EPB]|uniref:Uncharacterized protein n=1 Tax=Micavibrio aeruginosavorus EPB TaxID=349215 RepID=M4VK48_9BACT|nr:hypothetical protein A11S_2075 [Micavibrio aeruginosavorus EPB]